MKKIVLLALMMALAALMLAAAPASAQAACEKEDVPPGLEDKCDDNNGNGDEDDDDGDNNDIDSNQRIRLNNVGNLDVSPTFEASQETEQDCDTGEASLNSDVTGGGDNSIQTVGLNPSVNTGCAQTALGVLDFDPILGVQGGDFAFNADQFNVIQDNDCDGEDDDGDGNHDEDGDCDNGDDNGNHNGDDNDDNINDDNDVNISDNDRTRFGPDRLIINGGGDDGDLEFEDFGSTIGVGGDQVLNVTPTIDQEAAAASSTQVFPLK